MEVIKWLTTNITCPSGLKEERKMGDEDVFLCKDTHPFLREGCPRHHPIWGITVTPQDHTAQEAAVGWAVNIWPLFLTRD
jgi:hypothetical protein